MRTAPGNRCGLVFHGCGRGAPGIAFANILPETLVWLVGSGHQVRQLRRQACHGRVCVEIVKGSALSSVFPPFHAGYRGCADFSGFKLAVDDISGGNDRLRLIAELAPDYIKIDRYLVAECDRYSTGGIRFIALCSWPGIWEPR